MTERRGSRPAEGAPAGRDGADAARWRDWMTRAQRGDATAYRKLLEELLPVVRAQVRARLFDAALAEDVVQNAMLNLHRARATYRAERPFLPWLRAIVRNATVDALRERARRSARELAVDDVDSVAALARDASPRGASADDGEARVRRGELAAELERALAALPPRQREAVELLHVHGLSVAAAAARAGTTTGALKVRAHRGYRALRARLGGHASDGARGPRRDGEDER
ncbi:MAG: sigma-70 family RNA polymerase sigma factor [Myxococcota bacterium]